MLDHVLVAYDDTAAGRAALETGAELARQSSARLTVAHVAPPGDEEAGDLLDELLDDGPAARRCRRLRTVAALVAPEVETDVRVLAGPVADTLLAVVARAAPDLVVAGDGRRRFGGGPARTLLARAGRPVLLVPAPSLGPIVEGVSPTADAPPAARAIRRHRTLLWQLFAGNAFVLVVATLVLILAPVRVSEEPAVAEAIVLTVGLSIMLAVNYVLLRRGLTPLRDLTAVMGAIDLRAPGLRVAQPQRSPADVAALADAFNTMLVRLEDERTASTRRALAAQEDERLRIARELHDEVGQALTALTLQAERAQMSDPVDRDAVSRIGATALQALDDVRRIGRELRPETLDDLGLGNALITLCRRLAAQSDVRVTPILEGTPPDRSGDVDLVVYRIAQEALTNALRHADARHIELRLTSGDGVLRLSVGDDGRGMPTTLRPDTAGLSGMRERAVLVGGALDLRRSATGGTEVVLEVPVGA